MLQQGSLYKSDWNTLVKMSICCLEIRRTKRRRNSMKKVWSFCLEKWRWLSGLQKSRNALILQTAPFILFFKHYLVLVLKITSKMQKNMSYINRLLVKIWVSVCVFFVHVTVRAPHIQREHFKHFKKEGNDSGKVLEMDATNSQAANSSWDDKRTPPHH